MRNFVLKSAFFIFLCGSISCQGQDSKSNRVRTPAVSGSFYPSDPGELNAQLKQFFRQVEDQAADKDIAAIIAPHAGYVFSGPVAASAYAKLDPDKTYKHIFILGTSHHVLLDGASIYNQGDYETPLGRVPVDLALANRLISESKLIEYVQGAHDREHSIEVQLPFLQYHMKKPFTIVPVVIGAQSDKNCAELAKVLSPYFTPDNLFVISSDFSHYPDYEDAVKNDRATGLAVESNSPEKFIEAIVSNEKKHYPGLVTSCCGWSSVLTLLDITSRENNITVKHIKYMNSGDSPYGDHLRVVGYHAFIFDREQDTGTSAEFNLTTHDKEILLGIARQSIEMRLEGKPFPGVREDQLSDNLKTRCGAFVTLNKDGRLRGCIGRFMPDEPLYRVVKDMAKAAAFNDYRFSPVVKDEMDHIEIEISVLTPLKRITSIDDFKLGKQGIYIIKGNRSGTFLPQVAESTHWNKEEFLGHCARDKAGIGWDGWKDAELYTYEALVFDESQLLDGEK